MIDVTVVILTKNEEINLPDCLKSIEGFAKRVVVVDSGSTDKTVEIAQAMGAEVLVHPFETHAKQFNWGLENGNIKTKWTMRLDADERLTPDLCKELEELTGLHEEDDVNGLVVESWLYFMGRKIKHGCHNKRKTLIFKTGVGYSEDRKIDEHTVLKYGSVVCAENRFLHYDFKNLNHWISKMNWYATREMQDYIEYLNGKDQKIASQDAVVAGIRKKKFGIYYKFPMFFRSWLLFIYYYIFRLGFLDGKEGFVYHYMYHRWYRTLVDAKILEYRKMQRPFEKLGSFDE